RSPRAEVFPARICAWDGSIDSRLHSQLCFPNRHGRGPPMRRSIFKAGVWTALGLATAFAVVSANSNTRHAATTAAPAAKATVATAATPAVDCTSSDVCCAHETKAVVATAPRATKKAVVAQTVPAFSSGAVIA